MFKFNFNSEEGVEAGNSEVKKAANEAAPKVAEKITPKLPEEPSDDDDNLPCTTFTSNGMEIHLLEQVEEDAERENSHTDLIPGIYEGGFKVWECTQDLADYLHENLTDELRGKTVLDLGCGAGILGIIALKLGAAKCHFQDYNRDVLEKFTIPNVHLNNGEKVYIDKCQFYSGDWKSYAEATTDTFDIILTSETIYNPENNGKLIDLFMGKLKRDGMAILAAKTYYFGVGGGLRHFEELLRDKMTSKVVWKNTDGVKREIIKIQHI